MNSINQKINKYQLKLKRSSDPQKTYVYNQKINYYKSLIMEGGESVLLNNLINKQKDEAQKQIDDILKSLDNNNIKSQIDDLNISSDELLKNYDVLGSDLKSAVTGYSNTVNDIVNSISGLKNRTLDTVDLINIKNKMDMFPKSLDELIKLSLARDSIAGKPIDDELQYYGLGVEDLQEYIQKIQNSGMAQQTTNMNASLTNAEMPIENITNINTQTMNVSNGQSFATNVNMSNGQSVNASNGQSIATNINALNGQSVTPNVNASINALSNENNKQSGGQISNEEYNSFFNMNQYNNRTNNNGPKNKNNYNPKYGGAYGTNYNKYPERNDDLGVNEDEKYNYAPENYTNSRSSQNRNTRVNNNTEGNSRNNNFSIGNNYNEIKSSTYGENNFAGMGSRDRENYDKSFGGINDTFTGYNNNTMGGYNGNNSDYNGNNNGNNSDYTNSSRKNATNENYRNFGQRGNNNY